MEMICIAGKNDIASNVLAFVVNHYGPERVVAVANRDDDGQVGWQNSLIATAQRLGVPLLTLDAVYELDGLHFFSVEFDRIVIPSRFKRAELYNIHFSLLPRYKGVYTAVWPLLHGDAETGVTLHRIEAGIDTGPIIHQQAIPLAPEATARDAYHLCLQAGYEVLCDFIPQLVEQPLPGVPQASFGSTYYGPKSINYRELTIDLRQTAYQVHNAVRAFTFQEYQLPLVLGRHVNGSRITTTPSLLKPGTIVEESPTGFFLSTIDFDLYLQKDYSLVLFEAIEQDDLAHVAQALPYVSNLEVRNRKGWTPLMIACYKNQLATAKSLVAAGADVNAVNKKGTTVLMYAKTAAVNTNTALVEYLLAHGADASAKDVKGLSALDYAYLENDAAVIDCLTKWKNK